MIAVAVYYAAATSLDVLVVALGKLGAHHAGNVGAPRVPIEQLIADSEDLRFAAGITVIADSWSADVTRSPVSSIRLVLASDDEAQAADLMHQLIALGEIDFAVVAPESKGRQTADEHRRVMAAATLPFHYRRHGPLGFGSLAILGPRLVALLDPPIAASPDGMLHVESEEQRQRLAESGLLAAVAGPPMFRETPGPRWVAPALVEPQVASQPAHATVIRTLFSSVDSEAGPASDVEGSGTNAPFSTLAGIRVRESELEGARLSYSDFEDSELDDVGFVGATLRGIVARRVSWTDVSLVEADLRWATFEDAELARSSLDQANCTGCDLTNVRQVLSGDGTIFDDAIANGFATRRPATFRGASFRRTQLRGARFDGVDLQNAVFERADLTDASFRDADLNGASFVDCVLEGTIFDGARGLALPRTPNPRA